MGTLEESVGDGKLPVKPDRIRKYKGGGSAKVLKYRDLLPFAEEFDRPIKAQTGPQTSCGRKTSFIARARRTRLAA
jgi:hypothetical protein